MKFITTESLSRPEVLRWHRRMMERYTPPRGIKLTVVLPCSAKKPYSRSKSHRLFEEYIKKGAGRKMGLVHEVILTSPLGLVPRELESVYPAAHYDTPVTGHWTTEEKEIAVRLLRGYMEKAKTKVIAHVDGAYSDIANELDIPLTGDNIRSKECLNALASETSNVLEKFSPKKRDRIGPYRNLCDFQFGKGAKEFLFPLGTGENRGRLFFSGSQVAAINRGTGYLALTLEGGRMLKDFGKNRVEISFKPETNNIFGIGVDAADGRIRPGEEVIVIFKDEAVGVGRAVLNGREMERVKKGLSVAMRHRL